jgi:hypothetical protein
MIVLLGCIFIKQKAIFEFLVIIVGSLQYSFVVVYTASEVISRGKEGMEDAILDALSLSGCSSFLPCVVRVVAAWTLTLLRVAICIGQQTESQKLKEQLEAERIREQVEKAIMEEDATLRDEEDGASQNSTAIEEEEEEEAAEETIEEEIKNNA